jgi:hypothetical protein
MSNLPWGVDVRLVRNMAVVTGACALAAAASASAGSAVSAAGNAASARQPDVVVHPAVLHATGHAEKQPPTTAACEQAFSIACYQPGQIQQAYNLPVLFRHGVNGRGATIVIVDSFGSPTIQNDLSVFDRTFGLPAPPVVQGHPASGQGAAL